MIAACPGCAVAPVAEASVASATPDAYFSVPSVHCAACIGKVERAVRGLPHVRDARVNLSLKRLSVFGTAAAEDVLSALAKAGFDAYPLDATELTAQAPNAERALLMRVSVAGAAMMNVMLLSVAVWSGATDATRDLFHLISGGIAVPAVAYSAQPFFRNAMQALRGGRLNMDVPISLAILLAVGMSLFEALSGGDHAYFDAALSLTFFLLIGRYLDQRTRTAARSAAQELTALEPHDALRLTGNEAQTIHSKDLRVGDCVLVPKGARIPVDGTLVSELAVLDSALLTGESAPIATAAGHTVQAGQVNLGEPIQVTVTAALKDTSLRKMASLVALAENGRNRYTALADRAAQIYAPGVHLLALLAFVGWMAVGSDPRQALNIAIAVLIITCPCALGLAVPAVSTAAVGRLFSLGFLVKHATALERLAEVDTVIFDKTGTLTLPQTGGQLGDLSSEAQSIARTLAQNSDHPVARTVMGALIDVPTTQISGIQEVAGCGIEGQFGDQTVRLGKAAWLGASFDGTGLKIGEGPALPLTTEEVVRPGAADAIRAMEKLGLAVEILTGDRAAAASQVARQLGVTQVSADMTSAQKLAYLDDLAQRGHKVLMIGDGLNDTGALSAAHASVAPASALDAARAASDIVVLAQDFAQLPTLLKIARATRLFSVQNFAIAACYNMVAIPVALAGFATPLMAALAMSLSSITVLLNAQRIRGVR